MKPVNNQITIKKERPAEIKTEDIDNMPYIKEVVDCGKEDITHKIQAIEAEKHRIIQELVLVKGQNQDLNLKLLEKDRTIKKLNGQLQNASDGLQKSQEEIARCSKNVDDFKFKYQASQSENAKIGRESKLLLAQMKQLQLSTKNHDTQTMVQSNNHVDSNAIDEYEVHKLLNHKIVKGQIKYLVKWKDSWVKECNLDCPRLLSTYKKTKNFK